MKKDAESEYVIYLEKEVKKEYDTLSDEDKTEIDNNIRSKQKNRSFLKQSESAFKLYIESERFKYIMKRIEDKTLTFEAFYEGYRKEIL